MKMTMDQITAAHPNVAKLESQAGRELLAEMMDQMQALAVENAGLKSKGRELLGEACAVYAKLNKLIDPTIGDFVDGQTLHEFQFVLDVKTPATDRFLAEVKAQGVDSAMEHMLDSGSLTFGDCYISLIEFAQQLRGEKAE